MKTHLSIQIEICCGVIVVHVIFACSFCCFVWKGSSIVTDSVLFALDKFPFE